MHKVSRAELCIILQASLEFIDLCNTSTTTSALKELNTRLPGVKIVCDNIEDSQDTLSMVSEGGREPQSVRQGERLQLLAMSAKMLWRMRLHETNH